MRLFFLFTILIVGQIGFSQENKLMTIEYLETKREDNINAHWQALYNLQLTNGVSNYYFKSTNLNAKSNGNENSIIFKPNSNVKNEDFLYKDYRNNEMYSKDLIGFRFKTIKDSINNFNWTIKKDTLKILGYTCTLAEAYFRGRKYKAWFTSALPAGGPWKLDGLPGLILKADTKEGYFSIEATNIKINTKAQGFDISNPFASEKKLYTWSEFKKLYKEKAINTSKFKTEEMNSVITAPKMRLERYIAEDDPDYNPQKIINSLNKN